MIEDIRKQEAIANFQGTPTKRWRLPSEIFGMWSAGTKSASGIHTGRSDKHLAFSYVPW